VNSTYPILDGINSPEDVKSLKIQQLPQLAGELRSFIISTVAKTGGHLAPSLGVIELTIALHRIFNSPRDKIIWDVGHQAYAHKILTGRREQFSSLRQLGGISGFPRRDESEHDAFGAGHASTSISAALGFACARDLAGEHYRVLAVIGDGSLTGGLALEGLDRAGELGKDMLVILNDNEMSISPNVGAIARYLGRLITTPGYDRFRSQMQELVKGIPTYGGTLFNLARRFEEGLKHMMVRGVLFEELGFRYLGPIDGHDISQLLDTLEGTKNLSGPVLLHIVTKKGKGYPPAENDASKFHGLGSFNHNTGECPKIEGRTYTQVFGDWAVVQGERDPRLVVITAAMPDGTGTSAFRDRFPERFYDVGISEGHATTFAGGLAAAGYHPVFAVYSTFLQRSYDMLIHDICLQRLPILLAIDRGGLVGEDGPTHHGVFDLAYLRQIPNMVVGAPKDESELVAMLNAGAAFEGPFAVRYPRGLGEGVDVDFDISPLKIGQGELIRQGERVAIVALGRMVKCSLSAGEILAKENFPVTLVNGRWVKPLDEDLLAKVAGSHQHIVVVEEGTVAGGFGSAVLQLLQEKGLLSKCRVHILGIPDRFIPHGRVEELLESLGLSAAGIADYIRKLIR
jgi:1-deoxy-D-xylulose-5-phosphate synthase